MHLIWICVVSRLLHTFNVLDILLPFEIINLSERADIHSFV